MSTTPRSGGTGRGGAYSRAVAVKAASSLTDSPLIRMATRNEPTCAGVATPSSNRRMASLASSWVRSLAPFSPYRPWRSGFAWWWTYFLDRVVGLGLGADRLGQPAPPVQFFH